MFGYGLHDGTIDDDQVLRSSFHVTSLARIARIKEQRRPFETNPVTAPSSLPGQLHLVFLAQQPLLDAQKPVEKKKNYNNKKKKTNPVRCIRPDGDACFNQHTDALMQITKTFLSTSASWTRDADWIAALSGPSIRSDVFFFPPSGYSVVSNQLDARSVR